jgi:hypothetical protein
MNKSGAMDYVPFKQLNRLRHLIRISRLRRSKIDNKCDRGLCADIHDGPRTSLRRVRALTALMRSTTPCA